MKQTQKVKRQSKLNAEDTSNPEATEWLHATVFLGLVWKESIKIASAAKGKIHSPNMAMKAVAMTETLKEEEIHRNGKCWKF